MKACLLRAPAAMETNPLEYGEVAAPQPKSGEVLMRVRACGVCRTDLHVIEGELPPRKSPVIPGHQAVGIVERQGENTRPGGPDRKSTRLESSHSQISYD